MGLSCGLFLIFAELSNMDFVCDKAGICTLIGLVASGHGVYKNSTHIL